MKKVVLKVDLHNDKEKQKVMKVVSRLTGIDSIAMDMKEKKLTVVGDVDPVDVVTALRKKNWFTEIVTVGPAKEEKKDQGKKEEGKKDGDKKKENEIAELVKAYKAFNPYMTQYYHVVSAEENPNTCAIC